MAADERFEDAMSAVCDKRAVMWVGFIVIVGEVHETVVEAGSVLGCVDGGRFFSRHHLPQIPELHSLVFAVAEHVPTITFAVHISQTFRMSHKDPGLAAIAHASAIPNFDQGVVGTRVQNVRRRRVAEADSIDVVSVAFDAEDRLS